ncbi:hypothetical protein T11_9460 [Trichinella zimbabwensis]|uniref:Uncharacterized protein n=3 Tax=Trichinella zimbabwensis TaxID=268475 RepID=A0A0V1H4Z3_9BILA|nr:hypothetical protein T11_9460 [Trichinella zimbabwensis]
MDTTSDQTSNPNDSTRNMASQKCRLRTYDSERSALKYWMNRLQRLCAGPADMEAIREVTGTLGRITQLFFDSRQLRLDSMPEEERDAAMVEFDELVDKLTTIQCQADELLATAETSSSTETAQPPANNNNSQLNSNRPIPKLPTFNGDILQFKAFWDQFNAAVHRREDLEDVTKFVHLRSCLAGAALHAISGVTTAAENYPAVVQLLHDRFYRVSDVLDAHILQISSIKNEASSEQEGLLTMHDKLNGHLLELKAIGKNLDTAVSGFRMALPHLVSELPKDVQSRWKDQCVMLAEEPTSQIFLDFLAEQARRAVNSKQSTRVEKISSSTHKDTLRADQRKRPHPQRHTVAALHTSLQPTCPVCKGEHRVTACQQFLNQQRSERKATAVRLGLCFICLSQSHTSQWCTKKRRGWKIHYLLTETAPSRRTSRPKESDNPTIHSGKKNTPPVQTDMEHLLKKFWELESIGIQQQEEITTQDTIAICRTQPEKDPVKQREYTAMIEVYLRNGWVEEATTRVGNPVRHGTSPIMQCTRSLTAKRMSGSIRRADLVNILLRFRQYRIAVQADIEKMYLQVGLRAEDRDACRFFWRDCISDAPSRRH